MIIRCPHERNYTVLNNDLINDFNLDWKDLGLLVYLLSKPERWEISVPHLAKIRKSNRDAIYKSLNVLINVGYVTRFKLKTGYVNWYVSEVKNLDIKPYTENPDMGRKPYPENTDMVGNTPYTENPDMGSTETLVNASATPVLIPNPEKPNQAFPDVLVSTEVYQVRKKEKSTEAYICDARDELKNVDGLTPAQITAKLIERKLMHCNPDNQNFRQLIIDGATLGDFYEATTTAILKKAGFKYMLTTARGVMQERKSQDTAANGPGSHSNLNTHNHGDNHEKQGYNNATHSSTGRKQSAIDKMAENSRQLREIRAQEARVI